MRCETQPSLHLNGIRKFIDHEGQIFKSDEEAMTFATKWESSPDNKGWKYTGVHKLELTENKSVSKFEVVSVVD